MYGTTYLASWKNVGRIQGPEGPAGKAATIRIGTTTTGEAGTEASVENSGTETEAVFDFEIPGVIPEK